MDVLWNVLYAAGALFCICACAAFGYWLVARGRRSRPLHKAFLVAHAEPLPEYPFFAIRQLGVFSEANPTHRLPLVPLVLLEASGDDYGHAKARLIEGMIGLGVSAKIIQQVVR